MRRFNPERELYKIKYGKRDKIILGIILLLVVISIGTTFALYQVRHSKRIIYTTVDDFSKDIQLAVFVDGVKQDDFPKQNEGKIYSKIECDNKEINAYWNNTEWGLILETKHKNKCNVYFISSSDKSGANVPELYQGLIPITIDDNGTIKVADTTKEWYNYDEHKWANAVLIDGNKIKDKSPQQANATNVGANINNGEATLDGVDDYIDCGYANYDFGNKFSTVVRFKLNSYPKTGNGYIIGNAEGAGEYLLVTPYLNLYFGIHDGVEYKEKGMSGKPLELGKWCEVGMVFDGTTIKIYINGELQTDATYNFDGGIKMKPSTMPFYLGANPDTAGISSLNNITISKAMVYHDVLSDDEISKIYQNQEIGNKEILFDLDFSNEYHPEYKAEEKINMNDIAQMYVWIPRYKYQLFNVNNESKEEQKIEIKFENGTETTGETKCEIASNGVETCIYDDNGKWYTHPAFTFGNTELRGIWVGKFTTSGQANNLNINPNVAPFISNVSTLFNASRNIELVAANKYNLKKEEIDTHVIKNIEWGAVAYLTQSQYGRCVNGICTEVWANSNSNAITGCGGDNVNATPSTICNDWLSENGKHASTTDNIYGVYDMSGVSSITMGNMVDTKGAFAPASSGFTEAPLNKYYDKYSYGTEGRSHERGHLGDGTRETVKTYGEYSNGGWYNDMMNLPFNSTVYINVNWFSRGKSSIEHTGDGIFASWARDGAASTGTRIALTAQDGAN